MTNGRQAVTAKTVATAALAVVTLVAVMALALPLKVPIGAMYWDTHLYVDAAHRIGLGQIPSVDFFTPVGPLGYYLAWAVMALSANAQPLLAASWSIMIVTVPLMLVIARDGVRHSPAATLATVAAFAFFSLLPFNTEIYYPVPGADGFGIYNRHGAQLMLVLTSAVLLMRSHTAMAVVIGLAMTAMFFVKITAFLGAGLICAYALLVGRVPVRVAIGSALIALLIVIPLEMMTGMVSAYIADVATLVGMNTEAIAPRMLQAASRTSGVTMTTLLLIGCLIVWHQRKNGSGLSPKKPSSTFDHPALWTGVVLLAGLFFESQNTGSQMLILLWPVLTIMAVALLHEHRRSPLVFTMLILVAAALLPPVVNAAQYAARASIGMIKQTPLAHNNLGRSGQVTVRSVPYERATKLRSWFIDHRDATGELARYDLLLSPFLYSDFDFQIAFLENLDEATGALKQLEQNGLTYQTIMQLDFAQPIAAFTGKTPVKHIAIGADPHRALPPLDDEAAAAVADADIVLEPACPFTDATEILRNHYMPVLRDHVRVELTRCYFAWVKPELAERF